MNKHSSCTIAYLAAPYSHPDPEVKKWRLETVAKIACALFKRGIWVFSPLTHNMTIDVNGINGTWQQWGEFDLEMLSRCDKLIILKLPGWEESKGVQDEVEYAKKLGLPIETLDFPLT
jgi:nucleoside 2-deoxyribosyltransferase